MIGAVALLWSADASLIDAADPYIGSVSGCFEGDIPNAAYGYGVLDVYEAVKEAFGS